MDSAMMSMIRMMMVSIYNQIIPMTTTNKLVSLESVMSILYHGVSQGDIDTAVRNLPTYPEPTKWSNHAILQEYIDAIAKIPNSTPTSFDSESLIKQLKEIQSRLTEWTEYDMEHKNILEYINKFREKNWEHFFLNGWCYIFARILQTKFGGILYSNIDHCVIRKDALFYDITGEVKQNYNIPYSIMDSWHMNIYEKYENFNH